ncbi:uncharacterized protein LOC135827957 [Sycon ciliatum]|uniref:uncharacterized protein LOC135827957 n=1 Tax=Sycon ciliatum TaxID=27933 RepID=UPI0031F68FF8
MTPVHVLCHPYFRWSILAAKFSADKSHPCRQSSYAEHADTVDVSGIEFPAKLEDIPVIERLNDGLYINVFGYEEKVIYPLRISQHPQSAINVLLIQDERNDVEVQHWVWIKSFSRLVATGARRAHFVCFRCLSTHVTEKALNNHMMYCSEHPEATVKMPKAGDRVMFRNVNKQLQAPFVIYADCEAFIEPLSADKKIGHSTFQKNKHVACSCSYIVVRSDGVVTNRFFYRGEDSMFCFLLSLEQEEETIRDELLACNAGQMIISESQQREFETVVSCWICGEALGSDRVRDHCHITGAYRGAAHNHCNLNMRIEPFKIKIPVIFHNLKGYDSHHIISAIGRTSTDEITYVNEKGQERTKRLGAIKVIPINSEKYVTFGWRQFQFIDSLAFLNTSLDRLVSATPPDAFALLSARFPDEDERKLLTRKGVYPYEYMGSYDQFEETRLPPKDAFHSTLTNTGISDEDYAYAQTVWTVFDCEDLGDYHDLYLETDVLLLADVFENFRRTAHATYGLDPANYLTLPGFAWDSLMKMTKVSLHLISDIDMFNFIEHGKRGGISMVSARHATANNRYLSEYNPDEPSSFIQYLDANNLYGWAMSQPLPVSDFCFEAVTDDLLETVLDHPMDSSTGYMVECDLRIPDGVHDMMNDYPLAPEKMKVTRDMLSPYQTHMAEKLMVTGLEAKKLVPNLLPKEHYVLHYRNLQQYVSLGVEITDVHRVLSFTQHPWMKPYIDTNTDLRKLSTSDFEKDFYKLMNNAVYGKTMENVRNRVNIKLIREQDEKPRLQKSINKPSYIRSVAFENDLIAIEFAKTKVTLNKPIYVGTAILDLSKHLMYSFYYEVLLPRYGQNVRLLYTDTDSLIVHIQTDDLYTDMSNNITAYDTSNYSPSHHLYSTVNKKVVGKFKDELGGKPIKEFIGLRSKMYAYRCEDNDDNGKRAKGVQRSVLKNTITVDDYRTCLVEESQLKRTMNVLRSRRHCIHGEELHKIALCGFDSKRYILEDGINTLAFGHKDIPKH